MPRVSQRAPKACLPCTRRKMRCSKDVPCNNCIRRRIPEQCSRETVVLTKTLTSLEEFGVRAKSLTPTETTEPITSRDASTVDTEFHDETPAPEAKLEDDDGEVAMEAANTLESLAWGSHRAISKQPVQQSNSWATDTLLNSFQERNVMLFHQEHVSWTHNVLHMPTFMEEWQILREEARLPDGGWLALYYAVLSLSLLYMTARQQQAMGFESGQTLARKFYELTLESSRSNDFTTAQSIGLLQAVCIILPCAHAFGDNKRIMSYLSMATCAAQTMGLHVLGPDPHTALPSAEVVRREVSKRVWTFLCIQDAYLISFKKAYTIFTTHNTTPLPANCLDDPARMTREGYVCSLPLETPTHNSYMIFQYDMTDIARQLHDSTCALQRTTPPPTLHALYENVLAADTKLQSLGQRLPSWLKSDLSPTQEIELPPYVQNIRRTFRISFAHKRIKLHRSFFCAALTNRTFFYSSVACLSSAKSILRTYRNTAPRIENEMWTCAAHVISACIILTLSLLFSPQAAGDNDFTSTTPATSIQEEDKELMDTCLTLLQSKNEVQPNEIVKRGVAMIRTLLGQRDTHEGLGNSARARYSSLDMDETDALVREVEEVIQQQAAQGNARSASITDGLFDCFDPYSYFEG